jgi:hypothetical protein
MLELERILPSSVLTDGDIEQKQGSAEEVLQTLFLLACMSPLFFTAQWKVTEHSRPSVARGCPGMVILADPFLITKQTECIHFL